jgi:hypothetical protein
MARRDKYASILIAVLDLVKERGLTDSGSDVADFCNQLAEEAIAQADAFGVPLDEIGLKNVDTIAMLQPQKGAKKSV